VAFIGLVCPGIPVVRGQQNRVPLPLPPVIVLTEILQVELPKPWQTYQSDVGVTTIHGNSQIDAQVDCYGQTAGEMAQTIRSAFRTVYACDHMPKGIQPLYPSEAHQLPIITGEEQYETRWTVTLSLQYNPETVLPQDFADVVEVRTVKAQL